MKKSFKSSKDGIIGFAIGDAMGVPVEFCIREKLMASPLTQMIGYGSHDVPKGSWSDDTSMTLATLDSIIEKKKIDVYDIADKFLKWIHENKYTPTDRVFDIGRTVLKALSKCEIDIKNATSSGGNNEMSNGNGSLMRMMPVIYYCYHNELKDEEILEIVREVSSITHAHEISIIGCYIYVQYGIKLLQGFDKNKAYRYIQSLDLSTFCKEIVDKYSRILKENISNYDLSKISSKGYVVDTLEATFWIFLNTENYNQSIISAINLGNDTDTVGACTGGLAGILYGIENINDDWKIDLIKYNYIKELCEKFDDVMRKKTNNSMILKKTDRKKLLSKIKILNENIINCQVDCIVNAANETLLGGGGVDGAIHLNAGIELLEKCKELNGCKSGESKITKGYKLNSKFIIHTVAPRWYDNRVENKAEILENCYKNSLKLARDFDIRSIAFPCIGMGIYSCPLDIGSKIAINTILETLEQIESEEQYEFDEILLVCYKKEEFKIYQEYMRFLNEK